MTNIPSPEGINNTIYNHLQNKHHISEVFHLGNLNRSKRDRVWHFLASSGFDDRKEKALKIVQNTLIAHAKDEPFFKVLKNARLIEEGTQKFDPYLRDHISHSIYVYLLGIMLIAELPPTRDERWFAFRWKLASLLHDIGNPPRLFIDSLADYLGAMEKAGRTRPPSIRHSLKFYGLVNLTQRLGKSDNSFILIQSRLHDWGLQLDIKRKFYCMLRKGRIEHGIFGALTVLKVIDMLYTNHNPDHIDDDEELKEHDPRKAGWGRKHFDEEIVDAVAAISIHNLSRELRDGTIEYESAPLAFLLMLSDTIQEWDRYSPGQRVYDPYSIHVMFRNRIPKFYLGLPTSKVDHIRDTLEKMRIQGCQMTARELELSNIPRDLMN